MPLKIDTLNVCGDQMDPKCDDRVSQMMAQGVLSSVNVDTIQIDPVSGKKFEDMTPGEWAKYVAQ